MKLWLLAAVAAGGAATASAAQRHEASCAARGSKIVAASGLTRVYRSVGRVYACRPGVRRTVLGFDPLDEEGRTDLDFVYRARAAGRYTAFERVYLDDLDDRRYEVVVINVETRETLSTDATGTLDRPDGPDVGIGRTLNLKLRPDGAVAWIARDDGTPGVAEVWVGRGHSFERLQRASGIARSLHLDRSTVRWSQQGRPQRAKAPMFVRERRLTRGS